MASTSNRSSIDHTLSQGMASRLRGDSAPATISEHCKMHMCMALALFMNDAFTVQRYTPSHRLRSQHSSRDDSAHAHEIINTTADTLARLVSLSMHHVGNSRKHRPPVKLDSELTCRLPVVSRQE